jgi:N-acetylated-alpha-linked acidic dipeptidase
VDPKFEYGIALAQTAGRAVLRAANADVLPFEFKDLSDSFDKYFKEVTKLADDLGEETRQKNQLITDKTFEAASDPTKTFIVPVVKEPVPFLNFAPLQNALAQLRESAANFDKLRNEIASGKRKLTSEQQRSLDEILLKSERVLIRDEGLPRRPWFKHQIYAPGFYTGYGVKTLPGVREAIEQRDWKEAEAQVPIVAEVIERLASEVERAAKSID